MKTIAAMFLAFVMTAHTQASLPIVKLTIKGHTIIAEVASTEAEREEGLMHRKSLPENHGMLFVFQELGVRYFWMKDTPIPLDIAFLDPHGKILTLTSMKPFDLTPISSIKPCKYALEVKGGFLEKIHAQAGDQVKGIANLKESE